MISDVLPRVETGKGFDPMPWDISIHRVVAFL